MTPYHPALEYLIAVDERNHLHSTPKPVEPRSAHTQSGVAGERSEPVERKAVLTLRCPYCAESES
ncbi:MAG: hypothetical protein H6981_02005 [Gammaproteobacteria bacterium]|nr:hypothetical protein [Gammaproteobacteria bacterium]MCP5135563.1 hypothetical protein [Gammaproteobacteria bacterium]